MNPYFGEPWDAPVCDEAPRAPVPVGEPCLDCGKPIEKGDQGFLIPYAPSDRPPYLAPHHRLCFIKTVWPEGVGSAWPKGEPGIFRPLPRWRRLRTSLKGRIRYIGGSWSAANMR